MSRFLQFSAWTSFIFAFFIRYILCSFSSEELNLINYEVDILATPIKLGQAGSLNLDQSLPVMLMTSKYGQQYQCLLPRIEEQEELFEKEPISDESADIRDLLKPLENAACLVKTKDWWTYEICFGRFVKQYHIEDGKIFGQVLTLGLYDSDFDWSNSTGKEKFSHTKQKFHSQQYSNGTKCDLTGLPRNAEVRLFCEKDAGDYIYRVDEPGTCSYILTVHTSRVCSHPMLKPPPTKKAQSISCSPLLTEEQYANYLKKLKRDKQLAEEKRSQWLSEQQKRLQMMKDWPSDSIVQINGGIIQKVAEGVKIVGNKNKILGARKPINEGVKKTGTIVVHEYEVNEKKDTGSVIDEMDDEERMLLEEYDKELEKMRASAATAESFAAVKENIQREYDTLLTEAAEDINHEFDDEGKDGGFTKLAATLNILLEKLDKAEKDVAKATKELEKAKHKITPKTAEDKVPLKTGAESTPEEDDEDDDDYEIVTDESLSKTEKSKPLVGQIKLVEEDKAPQPALLADDKVHVRIRRLDRKTADAKGKLEEMDFSQRKKLEAAVKEKLEKAGLDTGGRRIEVKIITAGYYDNEDGKDFHALSEDETNQFQNMIMALLTGQQEAVLEMEKHKKLEENYRMVWWNFEEDKPRKKKQ